MSRIRHVGAALGYGTSGDETASQFLAIVGSPRYKVSHFFFGSSIPTSLASAPKNLAAEKTAGRRACLDFELTHYGINGTYGAGGTPAAGAVTDKNKLVTFLTDCKNNGLDFTVCLWHEAFDKFNKYSTQANNNLDYTNSMGYYGAALRALGIPVIFDPSNYSANHHFAATIGTAASPGLGYAACAAGYIDECYTDWYPNEGNSSTTPAGSGIQGTWDNIQALADTFNLPLGILELGPAPATASVNWNDADIQAFLTLVTNSISTRVAAGKPVADIIMWATNDNATQSGMYLASNWSSGTIAKYRNLFDTYDGKSYGPTTDPSNTVANDFESGSNGTAVSTGNSVGVAGQEDGFDLVSASGSGNTGTFDNAHVFQNALAYKSAVGATTGSVYVGWNTSLGASMSQIWFREHIYITALPGNDVRIARTTSGGTFAGAVALTTAGNIRLVDKAGVSQGLSATTIPLNQWVRIEGYVIGSGTAGQIEAKIFLDPTAVTPSETVTSAGTINTLGLLDAVTFGNPSSAINFTFWLDGVAASTFAYIGPLILTIPPPGGTIPYTVGAASTGASATIAVTPSTSTTAGDCLVANIWSQFPVTDVRDTQGNSWVPVNQRLGAQQWVTTGKTKALGADTVTVTQGGSGAGNVVIVGVPGAAYAGVDAINHTTGTSNAPSVATGSLITDDGQTAILAVANSAGLPTSFGGGFTGLGTSHGSSTEYLQAAYLQGVGAAGVTGSAAVPSGTWIAMIVTLQMTSLVGSVPPVPTQLAGTLATSSDMNALSTAALWQRRPPLVIAQSASGQSLTGGSAIAIQWDRMLRDTDGFFNAANSTRLTVQTQGIYKVRYAVPFGVAGVDCQCKVRITTGSNNPAGAGVTSAWWFGYCQAANSIDGCVVGGGILPLLMYPGDYIEILATAGTTTTVTNSLQPAHAALRMVST